MIVICEWYQLNKAIQNKTARNYELDNSIAN